MDDDPAQFQLDEIDVLKSICMDDFETVVKSKAAWKSVNAVHEFRIQVWPQEEGLKKLVHVKIHFKLPAKYPRIPPTMALEDPKGLSKADVGSLSSVLTSTAGTLLGEQMVWELVSAASNFITDKHSNVEKGKQTSLEDQRKLREEKENKAAHEAQKRAAALKLAKEDEESRRMAALIDQDFQRKGERAAEYEKRLQEGEDDALGLVVGPNGEREVDIKVWQAGSLVDAKAKVGLATNGDWLGRWLPAEVSFVQAGAFATAGSFAGTVAVFDLLAPFYLTAQAKRKMQKVVNDIERVRRLRHPNLLSLHGSLLTRHSPPFFAPSAWSQPVQARFNAGYTLIVLTEPVNAPTLESLLEMCGELRLDRALASFTQLVNAVQYLHANNTLHKAIKPRSIWMGQGDVGPYGVEGGVKLAEALWHQRLIELNKAEPWVIAPDETRPEGWECAEAIADPLVHDKTRDMWDLGLVFAQMLFGLEVCKKYNSPADLIRAMRGGPNGAARKVLSELLLTDAKKRPTASRLVEMLAATDSSQSGSLNLSTTPTSDGPKWIKPQTPHASKAPALDSPAIQTHHQSNLSRSAEAPSGFFWQPRAQAKSRYRDEFEELEFLGKGGGGSVVRAKNRLDGSLYAVKKIKLPNDKAAETKLLREVTIWSRMNHPNIVRYNSSWTETVENEDPDPFGTETDVSSQASLSTENGTVSNSLSGEHERSSTSLTGSSDEDDEDDEDVDFDSDEDGAGVDLNMDLGLDNFDDLDISSGNATKSLSYPAIHFGAEDDPPTPTSAGAQSPIRTRAPTPKSPPNPQPAAPRQTRTLYIQMEYVSGVNLAEAINEGIGESDKWKIMFQILSAMLHFTSLNIIHRDLKPTNIFLDQDGNVRIGDFGLATGSDGAADAGDVYLSSDAPTDETDLTSGVGTSLYIAPETIRHGRSDRLVKYSNKVDMYSLGVTFFELWHPFATGMERIMVLRDLRKPEIGFPPDWDKARLARHTKIVELCLQHDPEKRCSPRDLLDSGLLPPRVGEDSIRHTIKLLSQSGSTHTNELIAALFDQSTEQKIRKDFSFDPEGATIIGGNDPYHDLVRDKLARIFRLKGAIWIQPPLLMPLSDVFGARKPVQLLDADGTVACLPYQLNLQFCRSVARDNNKPRWKRWTVGPVYRNGAAGGQPMTIPTAAFDIVSDSTTAATEAECLVILEEIMSAFPFVGETVHLLNHADILEAIVERVSPRRRLDVLQVIQLHGRTQRSWLKTSAELIKITGVNQTFVDDLGSLNTSGSVAQMRSRVLRVVPPAAKAAVQEAFDNLEEITNAARTLGVRNIIVSPLLATNYDLHKGGALFSTHHVRGKARDVVAAGGRFDSVVARLAKAEVRRAGSVAHQVGFSLTLSQLTTVVADKARAAVLGQRQDAAKLYGPWTVKRADVYVVSFVKNLIEARLEVVRELWKAGIKADLAYDSSMVGMAPETLAVNCRTEGISWIVIVKHRSEEHADSKTERTVKLKSVLRGYEVEVAKSELVGFLTKELREQAAADEQQAGAIAGAVEFAGDLGRGGEHVDPRGVNTNQEFVPFLPDDDVRQKGRQAKKSTMIKRAQKNVQSATLAAAEAPVFTVDLDGIAFASMSSSSRWLHSDDAFRAIVNHAPLAKRDYLSEIRAAIVKKMLHLAAKAFEVNAGATVVWFWLFSLREDRSALVSVEVADLAGAQVGR